MRVSLAGTLLLLVAAACAKPEPAPDRHPIHAAGDYRHAASGVTFPERLGALRRTGITGFDAAESNVGAGYSAELLEVTVYVYPAGRALSGRLRGEFLEATRAVTFMTPELSLSETRVVRPSGAPGLAAGFEARFDGTPARGSGEPGLRSVLRVFQCGRWFLKIRATHGREVGLAAESAVLDSERTLSCRSLASRFPVGPTLVVQMDPSLKKHPEGTLTEWLAYGMSLHAWLREHASSEELAYGVPDHVLDLFVASLERTLDVRARLLGDGQASRDEFLDVLAELRGAGYLDEYVWSEYLGFLTPDPALDLDLDRYRGWRAYNAADLTHEVHSTVEASVTE